MGSRFETIDIDGTVWLSGMGLNQNKEAVHRTRSRSSTPVAEKREAVATPPPAIFSLEEYPRREEGSTEPTTRLGQR